MASELLGHATQLKYAVEHGRRQGSAAEQLKLKLSKLERDLHKTSRGIHLFRDQERRWVPLQLRRRLDVQSEVLHHLDAAMHQQVVEHDMFAETLGWPSSAAGNQRLIESLGAVLRDVFAAVLPKEFDSEGLRLAPIVRWQWVVKYNYYTRSNAACFPFPDLFRIRMWPLLVHEIGHARIRGVQLSFDASPASRVREILESIYGEFARSIGEECGDDQLHSHSEELLADAFGVHVAGLAYLFAFATFVGGDGDSPRMRSRERDPFDAIRWATMRSHPAAVLRYRIVAEYLVRAGVLTRQSADELKACQESEQTFSPDHKLLMSCVDPSIEELVDALSELTDRLAPDSGLAPEAYENATHLLLPDPVNPSASEPDGRTVLIAASMKRLMLGNAGVDGGSLLASVAKTLN